jgi:hypothetical protein
VEYWEHEYLTEVLGPYSDHLAHLDDISFFGGKTVVRQLRHLLSLFFFDLQLVR